MGFIQPFRFQHCTAFRERKQLADKTNEIIDVLNNGDWGIDEKMLELQSQMDNLNSDFSTIEEDFINLNDHVSDLEQEVNEISDNWHFVDYRTLGLDYFVTTTSHESINKIDYRVVFIWNRPDNYTQMDFVKNEYKNLATNHEYLVYFTFASPNVQTLNKTYYIISYDVSNLFRNTMAIRTDKVIDSITNNGSAFTDTSESTTFNVITSETDVYNITNSKTAGLYIGVMIKNGER